MQVTLEPSEAIALIVSKILNMPSQDDAIKAVESFLYFKKIQKKNGKWLINHCPLTDEAFAELLRSNLHDSIEDCELVSILNDVSSTCYVFTNEEQIIQIHN